MSLAPSVTELLFALGLGDRLVGVTTYCRFPPAALKIPKIGGYLTPSFEALVSSRATLAVALPEHADLLPRIKALGIDVLTVNHNTIDGILESATLVGRRCGATDGAARLRAAWDAKLAETARATAVGRPPRVVICLGRTGDPNDFRSVTAAGPGGIYDDLIRRAGGTNAVPPGPVLHPSLSAEGLMRLDPDVIVEFAPGAASAERHLRAWQTLGLLRAVRTHRVVVFTDDFLMVPGPRFVEFVGRFARAIRPEGRGSL